MRTAFFWSVARSIALGLGLSFALASCATYREDLNRGQRLYEENQYENALAIWRVLESDSDSLSPNDRARYAYLRGMTDFRLGFRADSRHWLAIGKAMEQAYPGGLSVEWKERLEQSLADLNQDVYGGVEHSDTGSAVATVHLRSAPDGSAGSPAAAPPQAAPSPPVRRAGGCIGNPDCPTGQICDGQSCVPL